MGIEVKKKKNEKRRNKEWEGEGKNCVIERKKGKHKKAV